MKTPSWSVALAFSILAGACAGSEQDTEGASCIPNQTVECPCLGDDDGAQTCAADGRTFSECACPGDDEVSGTTEPVGTSGDDTLGSTLEPSTTGTSDSATSEDTEALTTDEGTSEDSESEGDPADCTKVIAGNVTIENDTELDQLIGVVEVTGRLTIPSDVPASAEHLECLRRADEVSIHGQQPYAALANLEHVESFLYLGPLGLDGPPISLPDFTDLTMGDDAKLGISGLEVAFPQITSIAEFSLSRGCVYASMEMGLLYGGDLPLDNCLAGSTAVEAQLYMSEPGLFLAQALVTGSLRINGPITSLGESNTADALTGGPGGALNLQNTALVSLDGLTVTEFGGGISLSSNASLADISALSGATIETDGQLEKALSISGSPGVCQAHFDQVVSEIETSAPTSLLGSGC